MLSHWEEGKVVHRSVNACLCPLYAVEGMHVVTVEGEHPCMLPAACTTRPLPWLPCCGTPQGSASADDLLSNQFSRKFDCPACLDYHLTNNYLHVSTGLFDPSQSMPHLTSLKFAISGIGNTRDGLHPVQDRLAKAHGSQCGFCTPGFVMSMYSLLRSSEEPPTEEDIEDALGGNLW